MTGTKFFNQNGFRFRLDDGTETTATWIAAQNTNPPADLSTDTNYRIRIKVSNTGTGGSAYNAQLQYNKNGAGWVNVNATSSDIRSSASPNVADSAVTTNQLTVTGVFETDGRFDEVDGFRGNSLTLSAGACCEDEFCFQIRSADVAGGDTIQLRCGTTTSGTALDQYDAVGTLTVATAAGPANLPLATAAATSSATLALTAETQIALETSTAATTATLSLTVPAFVPLETAAAISTATVALTAQSYVPLETAAAVSSATLALTVPTTDQFGRPVADIAAAGWTVAPLWSKLDETVPSDADFVTGVAA